MVSRKTKDNTKKELGRPYLKELKGTEKGKVDNMEKLKRAIADASEQ